jgi:hypothetical protein
MRWKARSVDGTNRQERRAGELARDRSGGGTHPDWLALVRAEQAYRQARVRLFGGDPVPALRAALSHRHPAPAERDLALQVLYEYDPPTEVILALVPELFAWALDPDLCWRAQVRALLCRLDPETRLGALTPPVRDFLASDRSGSAASGTAHDRDFLASDRSGSAASGTAHDPDRSAGPVDADAVAGLLTLLHQAGLTRLFSRVHRVAGASPYSEIRQVAAHWDHAPAGPEPVATTRA